MMQVKKKHLNGFAAIAVLLLLMFTVATPCLAIINDENTVQNTRQAVVLTEEEQSYLNAHPEVTIALDTSWIPYAFENSDGSVNGVIPNLLENIGKRTGLQFLPSSHPSYADAISEVKSGKTMLVSGIANSKQMAEKNDVLLTKPYITINYSSVTKDDITDIYSPGASYKVAVCVGSYSTILMKEKMPSYQFLEFHSNEECMKAVNDGTVDIALIATHAAEYYSGMHEYEDLKNILINDFSWGLCFGVNKNCDPILIDILNKGIDTIDDNDTDLAIYSALVDSTSANHSITNMIYNHPIMLVCFVTSIVALILIVIFLILFQRHSIKEIEERNRIKEDRDQKDTLLNEIPGGVGVFLISNGQLSQQYMNDGYFKLVNDTREERVKRTHGQFLESVFEKDRAVLFGGVKAIMDGTDELTLNFRTICGNGSYMWLCLIASVANRDENSSMVYCSFFSLDDVMKTRRALESNSELLEIAIRSARLNVWEYDYNTKTIYQSGKSYKKHPNTAIYKNIPESFIDNGFIHHNHIEAYRELFSKVLESGQACEGEFRVKYNKQSDYSWEHIVLTPIVEPDQPITRAIGASTDITERKEKESQYQRQLKSMVEIDEDGLIAKGRHNLTKNRVLYYFANSVGALQLNEGDNFTEAVEDLSNTAYTEKMQSTIRQKLNTHHLISEFNQGRNEGNFEYQRRLPDGKIIWASTKYTIFEAPDTNEIIMFVYSYDVTDRVLESQIIQKLNTVEYEILGLVDVDTGRYFLTNFSTTTEGPFPFKEGDYYTSSVERISKVAVGSDEDKKKLLENFKISNVVEKLKEKEMFNFAYSVIDKDNKQKRKNYCYCYLDESKSTILYFRRDVTDLYQREQKQLKQTEDALEVAKAASNAKTEFFSRMSHDMRTPMNGILGLADLSVDEDNAVILKQNIAKIKQSGEYLLGLINDTLDFQKIESGKMTLNPQIINCDSLVNGIVDMVRQTANDKNLILRVINRLNTGNKYVQADAMRVKQIIINLLSNAIKFTPEGGTVELTMETIKQEGLVSHDKITVSDTGIGMSADFIKNGIFKPFSQENNAVTSQFAGSGLGLSIAKNLVEMMGGTINVESELGVGTTFTILLDFTQVESSDVSNTLRADAQHKSFVKDALLGKKILLVEDHPLNAEIAIKLLKKTGCEITWMQNGQEGVDEFSASPLNHYDVVLMDIRMPIMDGLTAAKTIRSLNRADAKTVPIIAMTANAYDDDVKLSHDVGMNAHLSKPIQPMKMYETIASFVE